MTTLSEKQKTQRAAARKKFIDHAWMDGTGGDDLLPMAEAAGLTPAEADALLAQIETAKPDIILADGVLGLRRKVTLAEKELARVKTANEPEIERMETEIETATVATAEARRVLGESEAAATRLKLLVDKGLLPGRVIPKSVLDLRDRHAAEAKAQELQRQRNDARNLIAECESDLAEIERRKDTNRPWPKDEGAVRKKLAAARAALSETEGALEKTKKT